MKNLEQGKMEKGAHIEYHRTDGGFRPGLYLVSTPIGNIRDITLRALDVLAGVDFLLCEDTRRTRKLLTHYGLSGPRLKIYNDHAGEKIRQAVVADLENGLRGALVSDAGTPLLSDPGYKLVQDCLEKEIAVYPVPGANAILPALQLSGLPCEKFIFLGFIPPKSKARRQFLQQYAQCSAPMIIYESAKRLEKTLKDCRDVLGDRRGAVVREITKLYEETVREPLSALVAHYKEEGAPKGEIVLVIDKGEPSVPGEIEIDARLLSLMRDHTLKEAVEIVAQSGGLRKNEVYEKALSLKEQAKKKM